MPLPSLCVDDFSCFQTPCWVITTDDEISQIVAQRKRTELLLDRVAKQKRRRERSTRQEAEEQDTEEDLDCIEEDDVELQEAIDQFEATTDFMEHLLKRSEGEYTGVPSCLVIFEALIQHNLETPGMFL